MGNHFLALNPEDDAATVGGCDTAIPFQLVYHDNILNGFVWQHVGNAPGMRYKIYLLNFN